MPHKGTEARNWVRVTLEKEGVTDYAFSNTARHQCVSFMVKDKRLTYVFGSSPRQGKDLKMIGGVKRMIRRNERSPAT